MLFSGPSLCERKAVRSRWKIVVFVFFFFFKRWNWLSGVTLHILLWHFWYYCSTFWGEKLAFFSVSSRNVGENVSTEWAEGELDSSATDCRTEVARLFTCARFCPLCTFYHILQTGNPLTSVDVNATANPPATPVTPAHTLLPCLHTQSCILTQFRLPVHSLTGPPERDCCPLHLPAAGQPLCCLLITSATIVSGGGGTPLFTGLFFAMRLKCCTALAMETWIALTHASIVLWPLCVERLCPSPFCASTNNFWLSLRQGFFFFFFPLLPSVLFLIRSAVNLALMAWTRMSRHEESHPPQIYTKMGILLPSM